MKKIYIMITMMLLIFSFYYMYESRNLEIGEEAYAATATTSISVSCLPAPISVHNIEDMQISILSTQHDIGAELGECESNLGCKILSRNDDRIIVAVKDVTKRITGLLCRGPMAFDSKISGDDELPDEVLDISVGKSNSKRFDATRLADSLEGVSEFSNRDGFLGKSISDGDDVDGDGMKNGSVEFPSRGLSLIKANLNAPTASLTENLTWTVSIN
ncbi:MAG: hypothetical protein ABIE74_06530 [Pseudomonadota bacterium]